MTVVWCIAGAGRGVGKTTLAHRLCEILPRSVAAQHGHGLTQENKPPNYFSSLPQVRDFVTRARTDFDHIVVESNALVLQKEGDVGIFLEARPGQTALRSDGRRLRQASDIRVDADRQQSKWKEVLSGVGLSKAQRLAIVACLSRQADFLTASRLAVGTKVWFELEGESVFGGGVAQLVARIRDAGSLQEASRALGMSYRYAWEKIRKAERRLGHSLVCRRVGGAHGGGSTLTQEGERLLGLYEKIQRAVADQAAMYLNEWADDFKLPPTTSQPRQHSE